MNRRVVSSVPLGVNDKNIMQARKILFFFCLFLIYRIIQFPLTSGNNSELAFVSDFFFQSIILTLLVLEYRSLKQALERRWEGDPDKREYMQQWLNEKLDGMNIRWRDMRKLAIGVLLAGFGPVFFAHLYGWLDALANLSNQVALSLSAT